MSIEESAVGRVSAQRRREASVLPIGDIRQSSREQERAAASQGVYVGPWGPVEQAESHPPRVLKRVDRIGLGLIYGAAFALWPFAFCFLVGLV
jgi:hypothetical protein